MIISIIKNNVRDYDQNKTKINFKHSDALLCLFFWIMFDMYLPIYSNSSDYYLAYYIIVCLAVVPNISKLDKVHHRIPGRKIKTDFVSIFIFSPNAKSTFSNFATTGKF